MGPEERWGQREGGGAPGLHVPSAIGKEPTLSEDCEENQLTEEHSRMVTWALPLF